jgi:hypothetical protein
MKNLSAAGLLVACVLAFQSISAQQQPVTQRPGLNKAFTIAQLPQKLECKFPALQKFAAFRREDLISLPLGNFEFTGKVIDKVQQATGVMSMNIRSTNIPGALFTVSVITDANNTQKLVGRIINPQSNEVLVLTEENNRYFFVKQSRELFMTE